MLEKMLREPILELGGEKDSFDLMQEMNMNSLLSHPVIIEVLNLVYEGQYSIKSPSLHLIQTFYFMFETDVFEPKGLFSRLVDNVKSFGHIGLHT